MIERAHTRVWIVCDQCGAQFVPEQNGLSGAALRDPTVVWCMAKALNWHSPRKIGDETKRYYCPSC